MDTITTPARTSRRARAGVFAGVAFLGVFGAQASAWAEEANPTTEREAVKYECELTGGTFRDLGDLGWICYRGDSATACDDDGTNCQLCWPAEGGTACMDIPDYRPTTPTPPRPAVPAGVVAPALPAAVEPAPAVTPAPVGKPTSWVTPSAATAGRTATTGKWLAPISR